MGKHHTIEEEVEIIHYKEQSKSVRETARASGTPHPPFMTSGGVETKS